LVRAHRDDGTARRRAAAAHSTAATAWASSVTPTATRPVGG
jgi:hypothetical protein